MEKRGKMRSILQWGYDKDKIDLDECEKFEQIKKLFNDVRIQVLLDGKHLRGVKMKNKRDCHYIYFKKRNGNKKGENE